MIHHFVVWYPGCPYASEPSLLYRYFSALRRRLQLSDEDRERLAPAALAPALPYADEEEIDEAITISCMPAPEPAPSDDDIREALRAQSDVLARLAVTPEDSISGFTLRVLRIARELEPLEQANETHHCYRCPARCACARIQYWEAEYGAHTHLFFAVCAAGYPI